jgi:hypothetical protein
MPKCKNDSSSLYTGNEPSPKGLGFCAHAENLNTGKKGKDGIKYVVTKRKDGSKYWKKAGSLTKKQSKKPSKKSAKKPTKKPAKRLAFRDTPASDLYGIKSEKFNEAWFDDLPKKYINLINKLKVTGERLKKEGIKFEIIHLPANERGTFLIDFVWTKMRELHPPSKDNKFSSIVVPIRTTNEKFFAMERFYIQHFVLNKDKEIIKKIFKEDYGNKYSWTGTLGECIVLDY